MDRRTPIAIVPLVIAPLARRFLPASLYNREFRRRVAAGKGTDLRIAVERAGGAVATFSTRVFAPGTPECAENLFYIECIVKFLLWQRGGWKVTIGGPPEIADRVSLTLPDESNRRVGHSIAAEGRQALRTRC